MAIATENDKTIQSCSEPNNLFNVQYLTIARVLIRDIAQKFTCMHVAMRIDNLMLVLAAVKKINMQMLMHSHIRMRVPHQYMHYGICWNNELLEWNSNL